VTTTRGLPAPKRRTSVKPRRGDEAIFQMAIIGLIKYRHLWHYHVSDSRTCPPGWPDLVILGPGGILMRELKTEVGRLSKEQVSVIGMLEQAGMNVAVWRPSDLVSGQVIAELDSIRRPRVRLQPGDVAWLAGQLRTFDQARTEEEQVWTRMRSLLETLLGVEIG
jgi:hypothetical protein